MQFLSLARTSSKTIRLGLFSLISIVGMISAADYQLVEHSIQWTGSMPAKTHTGLLTPQSSTIRISDAGVVEHLEVVLDMDSIDVTDLKGKSRNKLTKHLKSEDFFHVKKHPTARFTMDTHENGALMGVIEIRGVTKPFTIPVSVSGNARSGWSLTGAFEFDRQDFNVNYQNGGFFGVAKDKLIRDAVKLEIALKVAS